MVMTAAVAACRSANAFPRYEAGHGYDSLVDVRTPKPVAWSPMAIAPAVLATRSPHGLLLKAESGRIRRFPLSGVEGRCATWGVGLTRADW
jgi:hypothetical protein